MKKQKTVEHGKYGVIFIIPFFFVFLGLANNTEPPYEKLGLEKEEITKATILQSEIAEDNNEVEQSSSEDSKQEETSTLEENI